MGVKRKLILIGICVGVILVVFSVNVLKKMKEDKQDKLSEENPMENIITRAEAYRLLSYLEYDKSEREAIPKGISYADQKQSGWYDTYVNAVWKMGLIDSQITTAPTQALTYGACKELIDQLIIKKPDFQSVYENLSFDFTKAEENMLIEDFLELYQSILAAIPKEEQTVKEETLLVLGRDVTEDGRDRIVTDAGKYYYLDSKNYMNYLPDMAQSNLPTDAVKSTPDSTYLIDEFIDKGINVLTSGQEILYIKGVTTEKIILHNVWIKQGEGTEVDAFVNGLNKTFQAKLKLSNSIEKVIGDIAIEDQRVVQISVKPDMIQGKVLRTGEDFIEVEGYGELPLDQNFKIYKTYGTLSMEPTSSILVGYDNTSFIVSEGKISAAIITESIKAENIRVLIQTTGHKNIFHEAVEFTATNDFTVSSDEGETTYKAGDKVTIKPEDALLEGQRITVRTAADDAKIQILSIERSCGNPKYRGTIEISKGENGLLVVNELPLEEYLYAVIPSEMPTSYGAEALKVQSICARSYAYKHLMANSLSQYGAHVNDSVSYQVYNNIAENEDSILAVKDTYGKVVEYEGDVINAFYFSTSCGHTTSAASVWSNNIDYPYLEGKLMLVEPDGTLETQSNAASLYEDLSSEENFRNFLNAQDITTYDSSFNWYRWNVTISKDNIKKAIDTNLTARYKINPDLILTMTKGSEDGEEAVYESLPIEDIGDIEDITVLKRESSGIITEILIQGSEKTIKVLKEYNIRALLAPAYDKIIRMDKSEIAGLSLLPSAFFIIDRQEADGKLSGFKISGGGYGHGVGMSQNGVKALADSGKNYEEIITYFYEGTKMGFIYK